MAATTVTLVVYSSYSIMTSICSIDAGSTWLNCPYCSYDAITAETVKTIRLDAANDSIIIFAAFGANLDFAKLILRLPIVDREE